MITREVGVLLDIPVDRKSLDVARQDTIKAVEGTGRRIVFACANPHSLIVAQSDFSFRNALQQADLVVADGVGVTLMAKIVGVGVGPRITGADYFFSVMNALQNRGSGRVFFFGSSPRVLALIAKKFVEDFPSLTLCGTYSPPFGTWSAEENSRMLAIIRQARPDVLWVGMTAPKQEKWVAGNRDQLEVPMIGSIGAVFDFYAGTYLRAPWWMRRTGLEWAYRFMTEPRRTWRRHIISEPKFVVLVLWRRFCSFMNKPNIKY